MKKKILLVAAVVICLSLITSGTLAYFTAEDTARNVITAGGLDVTVVEQQLVDGVPEDYPQQPVAIMPGAEVSKIVSVRSEEQSAWIRMRYEIVVYDAEAAVMEIPEDTLSAVIRIEPDRESWTEKDGWWYYTEAVEEKETTKPLFETVSFSGSGMGNEYQNCTVEIIATAQAVQQANNGNTALEAVGWPEA